MKERPILFSGEMVRAILDSRKTQTRRIVKPEHLKGSAPAHAVLHLLCDALIKEAAKYCSYGQPGDRLWVRETFARLDFDGWKRQRADSFLYAADDTTSPNLIFRPSIFMPRWASRITLEIVGVRVERLNEISEADAKAEGVSNMVAIQGVDFESAHRTEYMILWDKINGPGSWLKNPWVWVIEFRKL